jgi:hypothetical protein
MTKGNSMTTSAATRTATVHHTGSDRFLRLALRIDAIGTAATGLLMAAGGSAVDTLTGIPAIAMHIIGAFLVIFAGAVGVLSTRRTINRKAVWAVILVNAVWIIDSVVTLAATVWPVTTPGMIAIIAIAVVVAVFAELEYLGLRRMS